MVEGTLSFEEWVGAAVVVGVCFGEWVGADWILGEAVLEEEVVVRQEGLAELGFGHKGEEDGVAAGVGLVE